MATEAELLALLTEPRETMASEYKSWLDFTTNEGKATLAKAAIALANHGGGQIVFGMYGTRGEPMGSLERPGNVRRYDVDTVNAAVNRFAEPQIHCDVQFARHPATGFEHAVISVPGISSVPIMSIRDCPGVIASQRCYIRKPGPKSEEPFTAEEWRNLINRCIQTGRETLLDSIRLVLAGQAGGTPPATARDTLADFATESWTRWADLLSGLPNDDPARMRHGYYQLAFEVEGVPPAPSLAELQRRLDLAREPRLTGWSPFVDIHRAPIAPRVAEGAIEAWLGHPNDYTRDGRHCDYWRVTPKPQLFSQRSLDEDFHSKVKPGTALDPTLPVWRVGENILFVSRFAKLFGENPDISFLVTYDGLNGRSLVSLDGARYFSIRRTSATDQIGVKWRASAQELDDNLAEVVHSILSPILETFDFFELSKQLVTEEIARMRSGRF